jgi:hypothetical protein
VKIQAYKSKLAVSDIGPKVSETKYSPEKLHLVVNGDYDDKTLIEVKADCEIDGLRPAKLMTKTLALVSELAGAGFEIMPEHARQQRLSELEWLLLANLPEDEIRSDTRAAFAAGRISTLVPMSFNHSIELLESHRKLSRFLANAKVSQADRIEAKRAHSEQIRAQARADRQRINHYFKLLLQAFQDYPDKPRLFIRALDYCRTTGQRDTTKLLDWIASELAQKTRGTLASYLGPLAIQIIARHIVTASFDISNQRLLARQRRSARSYLISVTSNSAKFRIRQILDLEPGGFASVVAHNTLMAAAAYAAEIINRPFLKAKALQFAATVGAPKLDAGSFAWEHATGSPVSVWAHWLDALRPDKDFGPGLAWRVTRDGLDPQNLLDRISLRKSPALMPRAGAEYLSVHPRALKPSDAGLLLEQQRSAHPIPLTNRAVASSVFRKLASHRRELEKRAGLLTLETWISALTQLPTYDPRAGEWTALEIVRQLVAKVEIFPTGRLETLDELHPTNILIPKSWFGPKPPSAFALPRWTWESWKQIVRTGTSNVQVVKRPISDFRRHLAIEAVSQDDGDDLWLNRLRGVGLLLLGLCCRDFALPSAWNIRGAERDVTGYVKGRLESATISSRTQGIIEAALLSRSAETAFILRNPRLFFGTRAMEAVNDTRADPPLIANVRMLLEEISIAQEVLAGRQISVLNHAARQLIPMNVFQLTRSAVPLDGLGDDTQ